MKKIFSILISIILYNSANSQTEILETKINVHCKEMKISEIIKQISNENSIRFSYGQIKDLKKIKSVYFKNGKLKFVLAKIFEETSIKYLAFSDQIILVESEKVSQEKIIMGQIIDAETKEAIPYATIMFLKTGEGAISDYSGKFELEFNKQNVDTLKFATIGYKSHKISTSNILNKNVIKVALKKDLIKVPQVNIRASDYYNKTFGNKGLVSLGALYMDTNGQEVALYIKNKEKKSGQIHKVYFKLSKKGNMDAPFRIRIYKPDSVGKPGQDILNEILVVKPETKKSWFAVDISAYDIKFPQEGLFFSMGGVFPNDFNFYFKDEGFDDLSNDNSPNDMNALSYGQRLEFNKKGKNNTWHKSLSHQWFQLKKQRFNVMIKTKIIYKK